MQLSDQWNYERTRAWRVLSNSILAMKYNESMDDESWQYNQSIAEVLYKKEINSF